VPQTQTQQEQRNRALVPASGVINHIGDHDTTAHEHRLSKSRTAPHPSRSGADPSASPRSSHLPPNHHASLRQSNRLRLKDPLEQVQPGTIARPEDRDALISTPPERRARQERRTRCETIRSGCLNSKTCGCALTTERRTRTVAEFGNSQSQSGRTGFANDPRYLMLDDLPPSHSSEGRRQLRC